MRILVKHNIPVVDNYAHLQRCRAYTLPCARAKTIHNGNCKIMTKLTTHNTYNY